MTPDTIQSLSSPWMGKDVPREPVKGEQSGDESEAAIRDACNRRYGWLYTDRESWRTHWRDVADFILPRRGRLFVTPNEGSRGSRANHKILDSSATKACRVLAAGMLSGLTSPSRPWFVLGLEDPDMSEHAPVRAWLDLVRQRMLILLGRSNFYTALHALYEEQGAFGTGVLLETEDLVQGRFVGIRFYQMQVGEYLLGNSSRLDVDTLYRDYLMTVSQLVEQFGLDKCSSAVQALFRAGNFGAEREVVHAIEPNLAHVPALRGRLPPGWSSGFDRSFPWRSVYYERGGGEGLLALSGYHEQPFMTPRWSVYGNDAYGRGPGMDALPDVRGLQLMQRRLAEGTAKLVNPPLKAPLRMQTENAAIDGLPGGITFFTAESEGRIEALYQLAFRPEAMQPLIADARRLIDGAFFKDLFLMISQMDGQPVTAEEIKVRQEEKMLMLGPVVERNQNELLDPVISRTFAIMLRHGLFPAPPKEMQGQRLDVSYVSVLAQAQRVASTTGLERLVAFVGSLAGARPDVLNKLDVNEAVDQMGEALLVPSKVIVPTDQALATTAKMHAEAQQQQQAAQAQQQGMAAVTAAQNLSQTDVGGGQNALAAILGNGPSPGAPA